MTRENATRSRWDSGVKVAALQMEMIFWGSFSVLSWARRDRVLSLEEGWGVVERWRVWRKREAWRMREIRDMGE